MLNYHTTNHPSAFLADLGLFLFFTNKKQQCFVWLFFSILGHVAILDSISLFHHKLLLNSHPVAFQADMRLNFFGHWKKKLFFFFHFWTCWDHWKVIPAIFGLIWDVTKLTPRKKTPFFSNSNVTKHAVMTVLTVNDKNGWKTANFQKVWIFAKKSHTTLIYSIKRTSQ